MVKSCTHMCTPNKKARKQAPDADAGANDRDETHTTAHDKLVGVI